MNVNDFFNDMQFGDLERAIIEVLYGTFVHYARNHFAHESILCFDSGKCIIIGDSYVYSSSVGHVGGCIRQLNSFANIETNESYFYGDVDESD